MIGSGIDRLDGRDKVTGRAQYSYERQDAGQPLYGFIHGAGVAKGRIVRLDIAKAEKAPGVVLVLTHLNAPKQGAPVDNAIMFDRPRPQLTTDRIEYYGQPVGLVVAETFEQARAAASLIEVEYDSETGVFDLASRAHAAQQPDAVTLGPPAESRFGDVDGAMAEGPVTIDETYYTPYHLAQPMEPHACLAVWRDNHLTLYLSSQVVGQHCTAIAQTLLLNEDQVTVDARYVGGGFGSKLNLHAESILASMAARALARPVKVALTRRQISTLTGHRPEILHRVRLAAGRDGKLTAIGHDANMQSSASESWIEHAAMAARSLYAAPNRLTRHFVTILDSKAAEPVRGPGELPGLLALETALDELAHTLDVDPVELRLINDTNIDPESGLPLNGRRLGDCIREGARRFGWNQRPKSAGNRREGPYVIGYGMASAIRMHLQAPTEAVVKVEANGRVAVKCDITDIGTGTYTIVAQVVAAALGVPVDQITVELAHSSLPKSPGSGGSWGATSVSVAVDRACQAIKDEVQRAVGALPNDFIASLHDCFPEGLEATGQTLGMADDPNFKNYSQHGYGASFAEVGVDVYTGEVRLRRMTGVFAAGRIINAKTARSQLVGGMIWGLSSALHEAAHVDPRYGNWVNADFTKYLVPVHADVPNIEAILLDDYDACANHLGMKGIGELGVCGTGAAICNAVFNATGIRVREFPITVARLAPRLSEAAAR